MILAAEQHEGLLHSGCENGVEETAVQVDSAEDAFVEGQELGSCCTAEGVAHGDDVVEVDSCGEVLEEGVA